VSAYTTVLVGTDGSESSFRAVDRAAAVAAGADADADATLLVCAYHPMSDREVRDAR
jgi:nucleotide-binding universal stress UspA family protein